MRTHYIAYMAALLLVLGFPGCQGVGENQNQNTNLSGSEPTQTEVTEIAEEEKYLWLITIEDKKEGHLFGVSGDDAILCEYTVEFYAVNDGSPSPYEGEFTVAGKIRAYWDVKEDYDLPEVESLIFESEHIIQHCTFKLVPNNVVVPLTQDPDPLLQGVAKAEFLMPTKGDNPANFSGAAHGFGFGQDMKLDMTAKCILTKTNSEVELITDIFGSFSGKIERLEAGSNPPTIEIAPLEDAGTVRNMQ